MWSFFLIAYLYLSCIWQSLYLKIDTIMTHIMTRLDYVLKLINRNGRAYAIVLRERESRL